MRKLLKRLFLIGSVSSLAAPMAAESLQPEQALTVTTVGVPVTLDEVFAIEDALTQAFAGNSIGVVDGNEIAVDGSEAMIFLYGPDAEAMFTAALPVLRAHRATASARARLRFGDVADTTARVEQRLINDPRWSP